MTRNWATVREKMLARLVQKLDVLLAVRSSRSNKDARCVSRARPPTCSIAKLHSGRTQNPGRWQLDHVGRFYAEPFGVRKPQGQRSPSTTILPGPAKNARGRAKLPKRDSMSRDWQPRHKSTRRDQLTLKGTASTSGVPAIPPASRSSRHRYPGKRRRAGHAGAVADVRAKSWPTRTRTAATAHRQGKSSKC